jgi:hypothetical protein
MSAIFWRDLLQFFIGFQIVAQFYPTLSCYQVMLIVGLKGIHHGFPGQATNSSNLVGIGERFHNPHFCNSERTAEAQGKSPDLASAAHFFLYGRSINCQSAFCWASRPANRPGPEWDWLQGRWPRSFSPSTKPSNK